MIKKRLEQLRYLKHPMQVWRLLINKFFNRPCSIELAVNYVCNRTCKGCYARNLRAEQKKVFITPEEVLEICKKYKPAHINITGGEPMLNPHILDIIKIIPKSVVVSIVTNGDKFFKTRKAQNGEAPKGSTIITCNMDNLKHLKNNGLNTIQISYGSNYNMSYNVLLAHAAQSIGLNVCLSVTNIKKERENIKKALKLCEENSYHLLFNTPGCGLEKEFDYQTYFTYRNHPLVREDNFFWNGKDTCPAGIKKFYITADKSIYPCDRMLDKKYEDYETMRNEFKKKRKVYCHRYAMMCCDEK